MIPKLRQAFNSRYTDSRYQSLLKILEAGCGGPVQFRICETPCFFTKALVEQLADCGKELLGMLMANAEYLRAADSAVPEAFRVPNEDPPLFAQVDFGLDEHHEPRLVEIQGFPSLYAYQPFLADAYREAYGLDSSLGCFLGGLDHNAYNALLRRAILGGHAPENVILLEIEPHKQKTSCDFVLTERLCGIKTVCITEVQQQGDRLFYQHDGKLIPITRIYNRVIVDELVRQGIRPGFDFKAPLAVEWAGHPNWYFKLSKFSLPYLAHPNVPRTRFLSDLDPWPADLENYVLKPLYSFAGLGVRVAPTKEDLAAVAEPSQAILQERVNFAAVIQTPFGPTQAEIRIMYVWLEELRPVLALVRMGRGKMMGVDHNRDLQWVGGSAAFYR
jgi:hypothetical protein